MRYCIAIDNQYQMRYPTIDTHSHMYMEEFDADRTAAIERAIEVGVEKIVLPNVNELTIEPLQQVLQQYPTICIGAMGLHPEAVDSNYKQKLGIIGQELERNNYVAIGEIGLDLYWDQTYINEQIDAFNTQIQWATDCHLPMIIHVRKAWSQTLQVLAAYNPQELKGIFHCFSGHQEIIDQLQSMPNMLLGIGGVITYKNAGLKELVKQIPLDRIVVETDAPYLSPTPYRGKRNESAYIIHTLEMVAQVKGLSIEQTAAMIYNNSKRVFNI